MDVIIDQYDKLKLQFATEKSRTGLWDFNAKKSKIIFSKESKEIIGFENDTTFGDNPHDWNNRVHPEDKQKYFQDFQDHLNGLVPIYQNEHRVLCKDGNYKWISDKGKIVEKDEHGNATRIIGMHTDITSRIKEREHLKKTIDLISKQNTKLKSFAHIVTHNLKEVAGNFESLLSFYEEAETDSEKNNLINYLNLLSGSLNRTLINLQDIVAVQSNKGNKIDHLHVNTFIENTIEILEVLVFKDKAIIKNTISNALYINFNPAYLESILHNLLSNALKYKHPNRVPSIHFSAKDNDSETVIKITDNGLGIDLKKYGDSIFGLYKTFHNNENAEGVGLYLVKTQIEAFGGSITVSSEVNKGSTFTIKLPKKPNLIN